MSEDRGAYGASGQRSDRVEFSDVYECCYRLMRRGERPSVRTVRGELGGGSPNTISAHLQRFWMELVPPADHAMHDLGVYTIPPEILDYTKRTWELMTTEAQRLARIELTKEQRDSNAKQVELLARLEVSSLRERSLERDYETLRQRNLDLEKQLVQARTELGEQLGTIQALRDELARSKQQRADTQMDLEKERENHTKLRQRIRAGHRTKVGTKPTRKTTTIKQNGASRSSSRKQRKRK